MNVHLFYKSRTKFEEFLDNLSFNLEKVPLFKSTDYFVEFKIFNSNNKEVPK